MRQGVVLANVRLPRPVVEWLDNLVGRGIYKSRSEAVRELVRHYVLGASASASARTQSKEGNE